LRRDIDEQISDIRCKQRSRCSLANERLDILELLNVSFLVSCLSLDAQLQHPRSVKAAGHDERLIASGEPPDALNALEFERGELRDAETAAKETEGAGLVGAGKEEERG
jgi:hypothetical protein